MRWSGTRGKRGFVAEAIFARLVCSERLCEAVGEFAGRPRVQVALCSGDARVSHGGFHGGEVDAAGDKQGAICVPQVVKAQLSQTDRVAGSLDAATQGRSVNASPEAISEH